MDFKIIKSLDDKTFRNMYEMSQDGRAVRKIGCADNLPLQTGTTVKVDLIDSTGKKKSFGLKTLYWASWNKAMPADALKGLEVKAIIKPQRGKKVESSLTVKTGVLLSKYTLAKLNELCVKRLAMGSDASGQEVAEDKAHAIRIVLHNKEAGIVILHMESQSWRDGYWFLDLTTGKHLAFEDSKHRKNGLMGDKNILWPENLGA